MSLDVYLEMEAPAEMGGGIYVRESGRTVEISREEWDRRYPGREPVIVRPTETKTVFSANITHNLGPMANQAGIYMHLWRPDELNITKAAELIEPLNKGYMMLVHYPDLYTILNPSNGWGSYETLVEFVKEYLAACRKYPTATVNVWR